MNKNSLLITYDKDLRLRISSPEARQEITGDVVRLVRQAPGLNLVSFTFANEGQLHEVIHQELDYFAPLNQPFTWKVYEHDLLPSLKDELSMHDFVESSDAAVMVLDVNSAHARAFEPTHADVRRITTKDGLHDVIHVLNRV